MHESKGIVGISAILGVAFLLVAAVIGVTVVKNRDITLNPNKFADMLYPTSIPTSSPGNFCVGTCSGKEIGTISCASLSQPVKCECDTSRNLGYPTWVNKDICPTGFPCKPNQGCISPDGKTPAPSPTSAPKTTPTPTGTQAPTTEPSSCQGICYYGSAECVTLGRKTGVGSCTGGICCGDVATPAPTPSPSPTPMPCEGICYYGSAECATLGRKTGVGSCTGGICCGDVIPLSLTPTMPPSPTPTPGASCANGAVTDKTYFCYNKLCLYCNNGTNQVTDPKNCKNANATTERNSCYYLAEYANPYYCAQTDPSWANEKIDSNKKCVFWKRGCGQTVVSMLRAEKNSSGCDPINVAKSDFNPDLICVGTEGTDVTKALSKEGISYFTPNAPMNKKTITNYLNSGWKVMLGCKNINGIAHWTMATRAVDDEVIFSDPYFGDGTRLGKEINIDFSGCWSTFLVRI